MRSKRSLYCLIIVLDVAVSFLLIKAETSSAKSMTLKVSHQFAAGDVRDNMGRVFGDMVTERTNGAIKFRHYPAKSLYKPKEQAKCIAVTFDRFWTGLPLKHKTIREEGL